ncbi:MAG: hypothetical protein ABI868_04080 [Acidobacteriota bacterium]
MKLAAAFVLLLAIAAATAPRAQPPLPRFEVDPAFPSLPAGKVFGDVSSVATDSANHVWVIHRPRTLAADRRANALPPVVEFDESGRYLAGWGGPAAGYEWPEREHGIFIDPAGSVWISGNNGYAAPGAAPPPGKSDDMLLKFTSAGIFMLQVGRGGASKGDTDHDNVKQAADMALNNANELFVADGYGNHRVAVFDATTGMFKRSWGANGGTPFNIVHAVKVSSDGLVYVADRGNRRVQVFGPDGRFMKEVMIGAGTNQMQTAAGLAFSRDPAQQFLLVADIGNNQINVVDRQSLKVLDKFGQGGAAPGEFGTLHEIATDAKGNIYTAELRTRRVQKLTYKGLS